MRNDENRQKRKIAKAIANYKTALLNNTKWREILDLVGELGIPVQFAFVPEERFLSQTYFPKGGCQNDHTIDCTFHGPFYLKNIFAIRCPRIEIRRDPKTGRRSEDETKSKELVARLELLGKLPIEIQADYIVLTAYKK